VLYGLKDSQLLRGVHVPHAFDVMQKVSAPKRAKGATKITASAAIKLLRLTGMSPASRLAEQVQGFGHVEGRPKTRFEVFLRDFLDSDRTVMKGDGAIPGRGRGDVGASGRSGRAGHRGILDGSNAVNISDPRRGHVTIQLDADVTGGTGSRRRRGASIGIPRMEATKTMDSRTMRTKTWFSRRIPTNGAAKHRSQLMRFLELIIAEIHVQMTIAHTLQRRRLNSSLIALTK